MGSEKWELGAAFLPASVSYLIGTNMFGPLGHRIGRWKAAQIGLAVISIGLILVSIMFCMCFFILVLVIRILGYLIIFI